MKFKNSRSSFPSFSLEIIPVSNLQKSQNRASFFLRLLRKVCVITCKAENVMNGILSTSSVLSSSGWCFGLGDFLLSLLLLLLLSTNGKCLICVLIWMVRDLNGRNHPYKAASSFHSPWKHMRLRVALRVICCFLVLLYFVVWFLCVESESKHKQTSQSYWCSFS